MKIWQILTVSAAAAVALPALAQMATPPDKPEMRASATRADVAPRVTERLGKFDADKNGTVTREEMMAFAQTRMKERNDARFAAMDADKNGSISRAEFDASHGKGAMAGMQGGRGGHGMPMMSDGKPGEKRTRVMMMGGRDGMMLMDGSTGIVIADAVKKALERFDATDTNKDGSISPEERKAQRGVWRSMRSVG